MSAVAARWGLNLHHRLQGFARNGCLYESHHQTAGSKRLPYRSNVTTRAASNSCVALFACACRDTLPHRSCPRARAGEDRTIAWTELVHPPALSRPTRSCLCPLLTPSLPMGPLPRSTRLTQRPFRLSTTSCAIRAKPAVIPFQQPDPREAHRGLHCII